VAADWSTITVSPTRDQMIVIDVRQLGREPFDQGAFAVNNVVLLHTMRVDGALVATGWDQARTGDQETAFQGGEGDQRDQDEEEDEDDDRRRLRD
jgi:hypothetical protein